MTLIAHDGGMPVEDLIGPGAGAGTALMGHIIVMATLFDMLGQQPADGIGIDIESSDAPWLPDRRARAASIAVAWLILA